MSQNQAIKESPLTLRDRIVKLIMKLNPEHCYITREIQFLAVSTLDNFLINMKPEQENIMAVEMDIPIAIACLKMAEKINGGTHIRIKEFKELFQWEGTYEELKVKCAHAEAMVLCGINYSVPYESCYDYFERSMDSKPPSSHMKLCKALKFLIWSMKYSNDLSLCPEMGARIYDYIVSKKNDKPIENYLLKVCDWYNQKNAQTVS